MTNFLKEDTSARTNHFFYEEHHRRPKLRRRYSRFQIYNWQSNLQKKHAITTELRMRLRKCYVGMLSASSFSTILNYYAQLYYYTYYAIIVCENILLLYYT